jgi:outer membrane biosynthesis protein TonB
MTRNRFTRQQTGLHPDPRMGRMLFVSLGVHLAVFLLFSGVLMPRFKRDVRPVYHVNLVNLPVKDPQAGRPDARPEAPKPKSEPKKPEPVKVAPPEPAPKKPETVKVPPPKPEPKKPAPKVVKPADKAPPVKKEPVAKPQPRESYEDTLSAIDKLKRKKEIEDLQKSLAALTQNDARQAAPVTAPAGMPEGKGTEAGSSYDAWLQEYLKQAWTLSRYQVSRRDLEAVVTLVFDSRGNLIDYRFIEESPEERFNDSVRRAVLHLKKLPNEPGERMEKKVVFNLKELLE